MQSVRLSSFGRVIVFSAVLAGCAQLQRPEAPGEPIETPRLGALDAAYDRTKWRWFRNPDGRALLSHTELRECFVNPQPDQDFQNQGFTIKRDEKTIGPTRYQVVSVFEGRDLWEVIYLRTGSTAPILGVFSAGKCQDEAERILQAYERNLQN